MRQSRDQLGPEQFKILGYVVPNMFDAGGVIAPVLGPRGGIQKAVIEPIGKEISASVLKGMMKGGLIDENLKPTAAGTNLYLSSLIGRQQ